MNQIEQHPVQAIGLMMIAVLLMSTMDVMLKLLVAHYGSMQVVFFRCAVSVPIFFVWILVKNWREFKTAYPYGHLLRGLVGLAMLYTVGECLREMQLPDAYALFFAAPLLITLLSGPVLGEPAGWVRVTACTVGFGGVLVLLQPSGGAWISYGALMGLLAVLFYAASVLLLRRMGDKDGTLTIAFWFVALVGLGAGLFAVPVWQPLDPAHWPWLLIMGVTSTLGQVLLTAAFRRASVAIIAPFDYTHMIWALIFSYFIWGYLPGWQTWIGAGIVIASGLFVLVREHRTMQRKAHVMIED